MNDCTRCGNSPSVTEDGLCSHCTWAVQAEITTGLYQLGEYLRHWADYEVWCAAHAVAP